MVRRKGLGKGTGKGYKNITGNDSGVHSQSAKGIKQPMRMNEAKLKAMEKKVSKLEKPLSQKQISNRNYEKFIIDSIEWDGYDNLKKVPETNQEKLQFLKDTFKSEYGHMIERVGEQNAFKEWLMGLPSSLPIDYMNHDIIKFAKKMGSLPQDATDKQEDKVLENYWNFMSVKTFQAFKKYKVK